jgi:hypothetical protein
MAVESKPFQPRFIPTKKKKYIEDAMYQAWRELLNGKSTKTKQFAEFQRAFLIGAVAGAKGDGDISVYDFPSSWYYAVLRMIEIERTK